MTIIAARIESSCIEWLLSQAPPLRGRRLLARHVLRALARSGHPAPDRPVSVIGAPRSGTTLVYEMLRTSRSAHGLTGESQTLWMAADHRSMHRPDDRRVAGDIGERERAIACHAVTALARGGRYVDKFPRNCFRVPYLLDLFPDACFLFMKRDGRAVVSSMISGWKRTDRFTRPDGDVPLMIDGYEGSRWKFVKPPGWTDLAAGHSLPYVCARQWTAAVESALNARALVHPDRWVEVPYESLIAAPVEVMSGVMNRFGLEHSTNTLVSCANVLARPTTTTVTPPASDKWRRTTPQDIERVMPLMRPTLTRLGYVEEVAGHAAEPGGGAPVSRR